MRSSERRRRRLAALRVGLVILLAGAVASGCLFRQRREMIEAREAYQKCVRENPDSHEQKCEELKAEAVTRQQRYGDDAQRAWGCGSTGGDCDPRDRAPRVP
jgi:hypothetical protein